MTYNHKRNGEPNTKTNTALQIHYLNFKQEINYDKDKIIEKQPQRFKEN